jgi:hypothetical protein
MNALVLANFPIAALIFAAIVGIPLWLTFKRPDRAPRYSQAATATPATAASARPAASPQLSLARQHAAARAAVPGRQHAAKTRAPRGHAAAQRDDRYVA